MRSRYTAFALGDADHLWRTWHPRTRPPAVDAGRLEWTGLGVLDVVDGGLRLIECADGVSEDDVRKATLATVVNL